MEIKFTAVIATLNSEKTIEKCINSILEQNYKFFEIIIIDNLSIDGTISKINSINDTRIKYITEKDFGIYDAWNKALKIATGDIIHFIGSDDFIDNKFIYYNIYKKIDSLNIPDTLSTSINICNKEFEIIDVIKSDSVKDHKKLLNPFMGIFFNKNVFTMLGGVDKYYKVCGDYEFMLRFERLFTESVEKDIISINMVIGGISSNFKTCNILSQELLKASLQNKKYEHLLKIISVLIKTHIYKIFYYIFGQKLTAYLIDLFRLITGKNKYWTK